MSILLEKSEQNYRAFVLLKEHKLLTPCVHCGYYSCFQKVVYILEIYFEEEYKAIEEALKSRRKGSLHKECIEEFIRQYRKLVSPKEARKLRDHLLNLKSYRIEADYQKEEITEAKVETIGKTLNDFRRSIKTHLDL